MKATRMKRLTEWWLGRDYAGTPKYYIRLVISVLIPAVVCLTALSVINRQLLKDVRQQMLDTCQLSYQNFVTSCENEFQDLYSNSRLIMDNAEVHDLFHSTYALDPSQYYIFERTRLTLSDLNTTKPYLVYCGFIDQSNQRFVSSWHTQPLDGYYGNEIYGNIINQTDYLNQYEKRPYLYQVQPIDCLVDEPKEVTVFSLFQFSFDASQLSSPMIYCVDREKFTEEFRTSLPTTGSQLFVYCHATNEFIASTSDELAQELFSLEDLTTVEYSAQVLTLPSGRYYAYISQSRTNYCDPLTNVFLIPYGDIQDEIQGANLFFELSILGMILFSTLLGIFLASRMYAPVRNVLHSIQERSGDDAGPVLINDEMSYINRQIDTLWTAKDDLQQNMDNALPILYTQYILNILHHQEYNNRSLLPLLKNYSFDFKYSYFTCSQVVVKFSTAFYEDFTDEQRGIIMQSLSNTLTLTQAAECSKYVFLFAQEQFCVITNSPEPSHRELLEKDFRELIHLFSYDKEYITVYIASGNTCASMEELSQSWQEANTALSLLSAMGENPVAFYQEPPPPGNYQIDTGDDNRLLQALIQRDSAETERLLKEIVRRNQTACGSESAMQDLYVHLYHLGENCLRREKSNSAACMGERHVRLAQFSNGMTNLERSEYIKEFYQQICRQTTGSEPVVFDLQQIKDYVDAHFCENLYLETLAEEYHTSPTYMSRLLKQALGMPFKQYLTILRVTRAQQMLAETGMNIEEIAAACGFNARNSFIRAFKQSVGTTPSEYRALSRKQQ